MLSIFVIPMTGAVRYREIVEVMTLTVLGSLLADVISVAMIRYLWSLVAQMTSLARIALAILGLVTLSVAAALSPLILLVVGRMRQTAQIAEMLTISTSVLLLLNVTTALYCVIPAIMLGIILLHKITWPTLSRVIYPLCRYKSVSNRIALLATASLCTTLAIHPAALDLEKILKFL
jgi:hypothetical protein